MARCHIKGGDATRDEGEGVGGTGKYGGFGGGGDDGVGERAELGDSG